MKGYKAEKNIGKRTRFLRVAHDLKDKRSGLTSHYKMLSDYIEPTTTRFFLDVEGSHNRFQTSGKILDSTPTQASNILKAGMLAGITPPSRNWFKIGLQDRKIEEIPVIKRWLEETSNVLRSIFLRSNFYEQVQMVYSDLGTFGTGCLYAEEDFESVIRFKSNPVGSYYIGVDQYGRVDRYFREYSMSVRNIVKKFAFDKETRTYDWGNVSKWIKFKFEDGNQEERVNVGHLIIKNDEFNPNSALSKDKRFKSVYIEMGVITTTSEAADTYSVGGSDLLYEKGYDMFPTMVPRWQVSGESAYGTNCPGFTSLGDAIQLQEGERKTLKAIDKMIDPPMVGPPTLRNQRTSILPNDVTYLEESSVAQFRPAHNVNFNVQAMEGKQEQVRQRIIKNYFADLFLMLANSDRRNITATEIDERKEEKLLALGPVLENLNNDLLDPAIDLVFMFAERQGILPEPPQELLDLNVEMKIQYISVMAQAQKILGLGAIDRVVQFAAGAANLDPSVIKKINFTEAVDEYVEITGAPQKILRSDDEVKEMEEAEQEVLQQQQQMEQLNQMASATKQLSETDLEGDNALSRAITGS